MEILDLIAKVSWDTNEKALSGISKEMAKQDKAVSELNAKNKRLQDQISRTNDPKRVKALNAEIEKTKKAVDRVSHAQAEQAIAVRRLSERHAELHRKMKETTDPKIYSGLKRELDSVDNKMKALTSRAGDAQSKFAGIGKGLAAGLGIGAGLFTLDAALRGIQSFVSSSIAEFEDAERTAANLDRALSNIGKQQYFNDIIQESNQLAETFHGLFDNDDIIKAQTALVNYGKVSREELSKLLPVILELASATANKTGGELDLASATEQVINILAGRGGATLRQYGLSVKDLKTDHDRMNLVLGEFQDKLRGSAKVYSETADGIQRKNEVMLAAIEERYGAAFAEFKIGALGLVTDFLETFNTTTDEIGIGWDRLSKNVVNVLGKIMPGLRVLNDAKNGIDLGKTASDISGAGGIAGALGRNNILNRNGGLDDEETPTTGPTKREKQIDRELERTKKAAKEAREYLAKVRSELDDPKKLKNGLLIGHSRDLTEEELIKNILFGDGGLLIDANAVETVLGETFDQQAIIDFYASLEKTKQDKITAEAKKGQKERANAYAWELFENAQTFAANISDILGQDARRTSKQIEMAEDRVEQARKSSDASVKIEEQRLEQLRQKRERYERAQRVIDAGVVVANQAVAISNAVRGITKAAAETGIAAPIGVAANVLAIASGIGAAIAAIRSINADAGFREGGYTGDGDPSKESTAIGRRPYKYHKREFVMNEGLTEKYRDMFEGMHRGKLVAQRMGDSWVLMPRTLDVDRAVSDHNVLRSEMQTANLEAALLSIDKRLSQREVIIKNNFDAEGFGVSVATQLGKAQIINKLRNS